MDIKYLKPRSYNLLNKKFGKLTVIEFNGYPKDNASWICKCECGTTVKVPARYLRSGESTSCGCYQVELVTSMRQSCNTIGGKNGTPYHPLYNIWKGMLARCNNPKNKRYKNYHDRGISVCERWLDFNNFIEDMSPRPAGLTLERINNDGNYEKSNCKWDTYHAQANNRKHKI